MKLIVGLGFDERDNCQLRHNAGYQVLDWFCQKYEIDFPPSKHDLMATKEVKINGQDIILVKFRVKSHLVGDYLKTFMKVWKISPKDLIVLHDDSEIDFGRVMVSRSGQGGNHTAVKSIIDALNTANFNRVRVGIGRPNGVGQRRYLLSPYSEKQFNKLPTLYENALIEVEKILFEPTKKKTI